MKILHKIALLILLTSIFTTCSLIVINILIPTPYPYIENHILLYDQDPIPNIKFKAHDGTVKSYTEGVLR